MKKLILALIITLITTTAFAENNIPGFLELDISYTQYYGLYADNAPKPNIAGTNISIKYGVEYKWFKPYVFMNQETFFVYEKYKIFKNNKPFQDIYSAGAGFEISIFYFEYEHSCSHPVLSSYEEGKVIKQKEENTLDFEGLPTATYDSFKVGIKIKID